MSNCDHYYWMNYFSWDYKNKIIRLSIFLITGVCAGFPALLWALSVLYHHYKSGGRISFIAIFLLLSDLLELILNLVLVAFIYKKDSKACMVYQTLFIGTRLCGHLLNQLVALEGILIQKYPSFAVIFPPACSVPLCIIVCLVAIGCQLSFNYITDAIYMCLCLLPVIMSAITCIVTCKASPDTNQSTNKKPGVLVLSIAMFTLIILYVPFFLNYTLQLPFMLECLTSMRLISEPLLCVLICRENHLVKTNLFIAAQ